ncbi:MAG: hypothetical protein ACKO15_05345, partial [Burkholderiales bacterium]
STGTRSRFWLRSKVLPEHKVGQDSRLDIRQKLVLVCRWTGLTSLPPQSPRQGDDNMAPLNSSI